MTTCMYISKVKIPSIPIYHTEPVKIRGFKNSASSIFFINCSHFRSFYLFTLIILLSGIYYVLQSFVCVKYNEVVMCVGDKLEQESLQM